MATVPAGGRDGFVLGQRLAIVCIFAVAHVCFIERFSCRVLLQIFPSFRLSLIEMMCQQTRCSASTARLSAAAISRCRWKRRQRERSLSTSAGFCCTIRPRYLPRTAIGMSACTLFASTCRPTNAAASTKRVHRFVGNTRQKTASTKTTGCTTNISRRPQGKKQSAIDSERKACPAPHSIKINGGCHGLL